MALTWKSPVRGKAAAPKGGGRAGSGGLNSPAARLAYGRRLEARKKVSTPKADKAIDSESKRLLTESAALTAYINNKSAAKKAPTPKATTASPVSPVVSTAKTKPLSSPKITSSSATTLKPQPFITSSAQRIDPKEEVAGKGPAPLVTPPKATKPKATKPSVQRVDPKEEVAGKGPVPIIAPPKPAQVVTPKAEVKPKPVANDSSIPPQLRKPDPVVAPKPAAKPVASVNYNTDDATETTKSKQGSVPVEAPKPAAKPVASINYNTDDATETTKSKQSAASITAIKPSAPKPSLLLDKTKPADRINLSKDNKTVAAAPKYNQAYWADQRAKGVSQADMKAEQDKVGIKKAYSGDKVITADMKRKAADDLKRVTGSMAVLDKSGDPEMTAAKKADLTKAGILVGGVTKNEEKSGLLGEKLDTTYDYKGGPSIVTKATDPTIKGVRLGDKTSTTFVDGVEVATKTGNDPLGKDAVVTKPVNAQETASEVKSIDDQIKTETDPVKLKALHKRRLMLMRMNHTNTRFAGLLDDANTKRSNLMSIG